MAITLHFINFTCITGILEQQYTMTAIRVIEFQSREKLDMEPHKAVLFSIYK